MKTKTRIPGLLPTLALAFALSASAVHAQAMNYQGRLTDNSGVALTASSATLQFNIWNHPTNTAASAKVWGPFTLTNVDLLGGRFNVEIGPNDTVVPPRTTPRNLAAALNALSTDAYIHITVTPAGGTANAALPRQKIFASPLALSAKQADHATTADTAANFTSNVLKTDEANSRVGIGLSNPSEKLEVAGNVKVAGNISVNEGNSILFRGSNDSSHGLGWFGSTRPFGSLTPDGPVLYGWNGGALGTTRFGDRSALSWDSSNQVRMGPLQFAGQVIDSSNAFGQPNTLFLQNNGGNLVLGGSTSAVTISGEINGSSPPYKFTIGFDATWDTSSYRGVIIPSSIIQKYLGDDDGCKIKYLVRRNSNDDLWVVEQTLYLEPLGLGGLEAGLRGYTWVEGDADRSWILNSTGKYTISAGVNEVHCTNYDWAGNEAIFNDYSLKFTCDPGFSATVIIYDY